MIEDYPPQRWYPYEWIIVFRRNSLKFRRALKVPCDYTPPADLIREARRSPCIINPGQSLSQLSLLICNSRGFVPEFWDTQALVAWRLLRQLIHADYTLRAV